MKTWILCNFKLEYVIIKSMQLIKSADTMFTNNSTKYIYEKKVENGSRKRENVARHNME